MDMTLLAYKMRAKILRKFICNNNQSHHSASFTDDCMLADQTEELFPFLHVGDATRLRSPVGL